MFKRLHRILNEKKIIGPPYAVDEITREIQNKVLFPFSDAVIRRIKDNEIEASVLYTDLSREELIAFKRRDTRRDSLEQVIKDLERAKGT